MDGGSRMICQKCERHIPAESEFCPYCGSAIDKANRCPSCSRIIPADSEFCPFCGQKTKPEIIEVEKKHQLKKKKTIRKTVKIKPIGIVICCVLLLCLAFVGVYLGTYFNAKSKAEVSQLKEAKQTLFFPALTKIHDPNLVAFINAWDDLNKGKASGLSKIIELADKKYDLAVEDLSRAKKYAYDYAVNCYRDQKLKTANQLFTALGHYSRSDDYLLIMKPGVSVENLKQLIHFENVDELLLDSYANSFLKGRWESEDGYYFELERVDGEYQTHYNLPDYDSEKYKYFEIHNGSYYQYSSPKSVASGIGGVCPFSFEIVDENTIMIYSRFQLLFVTLYRQ